MAELTTDPSVCRAPAVRASCCDRCEKDCANEIAARMS